MKKSSAYFGPWQLSSNVTAMMIVLFLVLTANAAFWQNYFSIRPLQDMGSVAMAVGMASIITGLLGLLFGLVGFKYVLKPAFALLAIAAAAAAYFMDRYGVVVDRHALQSVFETDAREGGEWLSWRMLLYFVVIAGVPVAFLFRTEIQYRKWTRELLARLGYFAVCFALIILPAALMYQSIASIARNHREIRFQINPYNVVMASRNYVSHSVNVTPIKIAAIGADAKKDAFYQTQKPKMLVLVIGESARAESFSLGGYARITNPLLAKREMTYFSNVSSCGTNTATSLPCMFSNLGRENYDEKIAKQQENLVDVVQRAGLFVEWEDNNTGSKGNATRVEEANMAQLNDTQLCSAKGCYDAIFFQHLEDEFKEHPVADVVLVLHQLGSHGPAYHERYPKEFERFKPACQTGELQDCSREEVLNAYDNTILYTDYVLDGIIERLKRREATHDVAMLYISDHGESTGEKGIYLHGTPYMIAPAQQTQVPMLLWASDGFLNNRGITRDCLQSMKNNTYSHDNLFHSVLGLLDIQTRVRNPQLDIVANCTATNSRL
jgi:lipid A ethanolaminephosphotransferase